MFHRYELWFRVEFGISDAVVIDDHQTLDERVFGLRDVAEGDGTVDKCAVGHLSVDDAVDQFGNGLGGVLFQAARRGFDGVGHHENSLFARERIGAGISEFGFVDIFLPVICSPLGHRSSAPSKRRGE